MMKRILVLGVLVGALLGATSLSWALDLKWGGDYRLRGFYIDNLTDRDDDAQDSAAYYSSRFLLTAAVTEDKVSGVVTLYVGGTNRQTADLVTGTVTTDSANGNRLLGSTPYGPDRSAVGVLEAYLKADFGGWSFKGGRSRYKLGHGIILDDAVDGLWVDFNAGPTAVTLATLKLFERTDDTAVGIGNNTAPLASTGTGGDADLYVANVDLGTMLGGMHTSGFLGYLSDRSAAGFGGVAVGDDATLWTVGIMDGRTVGPLHVHGELDYMTGEQTIAGTKKDLEGLNLVVGAKLDAGAVPLGVDLIYTSGQDAGATATERNVNGLNGNYPVGIIITNTGARSLDTKDGTCLSINGSSLGGSNSCIDGQGLTALKLSSGYTHGPHVVDVALIYAKATEDAGAGTDTDIGIELDATLTWTLTKRLSFLGGVGYLMSGDFFKTVGNPDPDAQTVLVTQLAYTF